MFTWHSGQGLGVRFYGGFQQSVTETFEVTVKTEKGSCYIQTNYDVRNLPKYKCERWKAPQHRNRKSDQSTNIINPKGRDYNLEHPPSPTPSEHSTNRAVAQSAVRTYTFGLKAETLNQPGNFRSKLSNCQAWKFLLKQNDKSELLDTLINLILPGNFRKNRAISRDSATSTGACFIWHA